MTPFVKFPHKMHSNIVVTALPTVGESFFPMDLHSPEPKSDSAAIDGAAASILVAPTQAPITHLRSVAKGKTKGKKTTNIEEFAMKIMLPDKTQ